MLDIRYLTDSVNTYCQAIFSSTSIDFKALVVHLSRLTLFVREAHGPFHTNGSRAPLWGIRRSRSRRHAQDVPRLLRTRQCRPHQVDTVRRIADLLRGHDGIARDIDAG